MNFSFEWCYRHIQHEHRKYLREHNSLQFQCSRFRFHRNLLKKDKFNFKHILRKSPITRSTNALILLSILIELTVGKWMAIIDHITRLAGGWIAFALLLKSTDSFEGIFNHFVPVRADTGGLSAIRLNFI